MAAVNPTAVAIIQSPHAYFLGKTAATEGRTATFPLRNFSKYLSVVDGSTVVGLDSIETLLLWLLNLFLLDLHLNYIP